MTLANTGSGTESTSRLPERHVVQVMQASLTILGVNRAADMRAFGVDKDGTRTSAPTAAVHYFDIVEMM
jgi:hypothetical protein